MANYLIIHPQDDDRVFSRDVAARLARVSHEFLEACEQEELIRPQPMAGGTDGFTAADVRTLARIRRLHEHLQLDMAGVEVVLNMRRRMLEMLQEAEQLEREMTRREQALRREIWQLRQKLASDSEWQ